MERNIKVVNKKYGAEQVSANHGYVDHSARRAEEGGGLSCSVLSGVSLT